MADTENGMNQNKIALEDRDYKFEEDLARDSLLYLGFSKKIAERISLAQLKELHYRGSWMSDKLDEMVKGRCKEIAIPYADECESRYYHAQLRFGDLNFLRYCEANNPEREFELGHSLDRYIDRFMWEPAGEEPMKTLNEEFGFEIKFGRLSRWDSLGLADGLGKCEFEEVAETGNFDIRSLTKDKIFGSNNSKKNDGRIRREPLVGLPSEN